MQTNTDSTLAVLRRTIFLISMPSFILGLMLPVYGKEIGASAVEIGLFFSVFSLMTLLMRPLVGWGLDRLGRRGFFLAGLGGYALTMISFAFIDQTVGVLLARIFQGISSSLLWLSVSAITADLGATVGPLGGAWLYQTWGDRAPFYANGAILGLCALVLWALLRVPDQPVAS